MAGAGSRTLVVMLTVACALSLGVAVSLFALAPSGDLGEPPTPPVPATSESPSSEATTSGSPSPERTSGESDTSESLWPDTPSSAPMAASGSDPVPAATTASAGETFLQPAGEETENPFTESTAQEDRTSGTDLALVAAACISAVGGACSGVAAIMVARRRPPSDE
ncbi:hypothetical protein [Streptomyces sp. NBC_00572]|uniref:hypothetical protein n=1 Tax=Streptomyces sp. NBC_00572 TaxID=2903664 RepID=UPI002253C4AD|nr:hypothetical protein [Streptomyces sp. NBC_00572]MCX4983679.1 hypothetical protein [Streptomyces sp. NBC_00572]